MSPWFASHLPVVVSVATVSVIAGIAVWWALTHRKSAEELEQIRRDHLVRHGRLIDGSILDWTEHPETGDMGSMHYRYDIAGVTYECAQDLTHLKDFVTVDASCLGMPSTVRYDPKNPANSIIVAEGWSGLHYPPRG